MAMGIVANVAGGMKGCVNEGSLMAKSTIAGVAYKVEATGYMEDCENREFR